MSRSSSRAAAADEKILSYNDVVLRRSDLGILSGPHYINDRILSFFFAHLSLSSSPSTLLLPLPPSLSFLIANSPDPNSLPETLAPLHLPSKDLVLFAVNDNTDVALAEGGTHWSLLVFDRKGNRFVHHDSGGGSNRRHAARLCSAVKGLVGVGEAAPAFVEAWTPQQENGYDCGVFVMAIARVVCERRERGEDGWFDALKEEVDAVRVGRLRGEVKRLVLSLMERESS